MKTAGMGQVIGFDYPAILEIARIQGLDLELTTRWLPLADAALSEAMDKKRAEDGGQNG